MYLRKTTTAPLRGVDILAPLYQQLSDSHAQQASIDVLQVGAGVGVKMLCHRSNRSKMVRRLDSVARSLPLPIQFFSSYEPIELYDTISEQGFLTRLRVADINPNVLAVIKRQQGARHLAYEMLDVSSISEQFLSEIFDVCVALNVLPHIRDMNLKKQAAANLIRLTKNGGYIAGLPLSRLMEIHANDHYRLEKVGKLLYQKLLR